MMESLSFDTIIYRPRKGGSREIKAIVEYPGPAAIGGLEGGSRPVLDIYVKNDSIIGISSAELDTGGDKLDNVPLRYGLTNTKVRIIRIAGQDKAILHMRAQ